jgi:hypothetical protein
MRKLCLWLFVVVVSLGLALQDSPAQEKAAASEFQYGGVITCKPCHLTPKSGAQFKIWSASPHAKAYETLKTPAAKEAAKKMGIDDPATSDKCLKCHVTAHGVDAKLKGAKLTLEEGVSCEACHGPGSAYKGQKLMKDIYDGKVDGAKYGLIEPTEEVCVKCHNKESPTFKGFNYKEDAAKIAHPVPKAK